MTLEAGTGAVHTAPGHGREDYETALEYGLDVYSPVDDRGRFTKDVQFFAGQFVFDANKSVIAKLKEDGKLLLEAEIVHSYPHCWRCKNPVIFRATPQWFISMEKTDLRRKALEWIDRVQWIPGWGRERIYNMVANRPDWCISRQRSWGVPITVFRCPECGTYISSRKSSITLWPCSKRKARTPGFRTRSRTFCRPGLACPGCGGKKFEKEMDILDVWFDSGTSFAAVLERQPELGHARRPVSGGQRSTPWMVSFLASCGGRDQGHGPLQDRSNPRLRR